MLSQKASNRNGEEANVIERNNNNFFLKLQLKNRKRNS